MVGSNNEIQQECTYYLTIRFPLKLKTYRNIGPTEKMYIMFQCCILNTLVATNTGI